ncbi:MAG: LCP family protein, partial [Patescibacteria group bacterium]
MPKNLNKKFEQQNNSSMEEVKQKPTVLKKNKFFSLKTLLASITILLLLFIFLFTNRKIDGIFVKNYLSLFSDFIFTPTSKVQSKDNRVNVLILGKSGEGHTAPDLTDTIMFASISFIDPSIRLISIPRDIWIPEIRAKLNSAYYWGKEKDSDGMFLSKKLVEGIMGHPIHYIVVFDFSSFIKIIDVLGGVEVNIDRSFIDEKYPIAGKENDLCDGDRLYKCRYEIIQFEEGKQLMNGETALKFVRSRNALGDEGTDIAREQRQQKIIVAVKNTVLSSKTLLSTKKLWGIWDVLKETVETNFDESSAVVVARKIFDAREDIVSSVIPEDFLINPPVSSRYDNQYVFIPK